jgi:hypothetical protein
LTVYTLMSNTTVIGDDPTDNITPVAVPGNPTRAAYTLMINGPPTSYGAATVLASLDNQTWVALLTLAIEPLGPNTVTVENREAAAWTMYDAQLNYLSRGGGASANLTMTV